MNIEIITTPDAALMTRGVGSQTACDTVLAATKHAGHESQVTHCATVEDLESVVLRKPDLVILTVKSLPNEENDTEIWLSEYFADHHVNFSGSAMDAMRFDTDKVVAKTHLKAKGISTANFFTAVPGVHRRESHLPIAFPLFLKPQNSTNSESVDGDSLVRSYAAFESKVLSLNEQFGSPVLVEEYLEGSAFTVCVIKTASGELLVSPLEIVPSFSFNGVRMLGVETPQDQEGGLKKIEDHVMKKQLIKLAIDVFIDLDIRDFGRIDFITNKNEHCFFMDVDLLIDISKSAVSFTKAFELEHNLSYESVIELIVEEGLSRVPKIAPLNNPTLADRISGKVPGINQHMQPTAGMDSSLFVRTQL